ncbi:hypothetical protein [Flavobacterium pectinovorum]|uniref:Uncharacterized protein n=1 Tax=Flavobacterium pectinovorum TaxID=29533 RepID=A0A502EWQ7_9FLAO|nr:hypothetical protein [Flavobacterium pectinovorum]TPG41987.1 hypothetical protein EAH81_06595 [Flavobacterium pectinovorum]
MIVKNHDIELKDTSASEMARFRQIMLSIWRQQIEDDKNSVEMEKFCTNYPYVCNDQNSKDLDDSNGISSGNDYEIDQDGNVTLKRKTKNNIDGLYKGNIFIGTTNKGALAQLKSKNIINSDFNEIKFNNRPDLDSFLNLTLKIQDSYDREVSALMVGQRTANLDDLRTKVYDLLLVGLKYSGSSFDQNGVFLGKFNKLPKLMNTIGFDGSNTCLTIDAKSYDIAGFYHTHPTFGGPKPSGTDDEDVPGLFGDKNVYKHNNLPGYIKTDMGWSTYGTDNHGKVQFETGGKIYEE